MDYKHKILGLLESSFFRLSRNLNETYVVFIVFITVIEKE